MGADRRRDDARCDPWLAFDQAARERHGVADTLLATANGVALTRFHKRTAREGWSRPRPGLRLHPPVPDSVQQRLMVVATGTAGLAAASRDTAAWLHGLQPWPPERPSVAVAHDCRATGYRDVTVHRARWLRPEDVVEVQGIPTLSVPATLLSGSRAPEARQRARLIDVLHRGLATAEAILALLDRAGPVPGKGTLRHLCEELGPLVVESILQDAVARALLDLGYPVDRSTHHIETPDGIGLIADIALVLWCIALETEGDGFHRTREQRRIDRRRIAAYAGTDWIPVPIDWRDWVEAPERVLDAIDAAIAAQRRRGIGSEHLSPRRPGRTGVAGTPVLADLPGADRVIGDTFRTR